MSSASLKCWNWSNAKWSSLLSERTQST